jgi:hypothetical protein
VHLDQDPGWQAWEDTMQKDGFAPSKYAKTTLDEDGGHESAFAWPA